jgi:hypothetical protein
MAESKVVLDYKLEHTNKEPDETYLVHSCLLCCVTASSTGVHLLRSRPLLCLHFASIHLMILL